MYQYKDELDISDIVFETALLAAILVIMIFMWKLYFVNRRENKWTIALIGITVYALGSLFDLLSEFFEVPDSFDNLMSKGLKVVGVSMFSLGMVTIIRYLIKVTNTDTLTQLFTKQHFLKILEQEWENSKKNDLSFSILFLDLNGFKQINDTLGHRIGDVVLREVAIKIKENSRVTDVAARYGGDEFIILLPQTDEIQSVQLLKNIQKAVSGTELPLQLPFGISGGIANFPNDGYSINELINLADKRMYQNKAELKKETTIRDN